MSRFALVEAVEALTRESYVVLTADQAEAVTALLGEVAFGVLPEHESVWREELASRAEDVLAAWPTGVHREEQQRNE